MADSRFYWLKLKRDFFKRHDIKIIESMPNGKDYVLFYLKLLCESVDHEGRLRFSDTVPYSMEMLSVITDTNVDIVKNATSLFLELGMMECIDDGTYYMTEVAKLTGSAADNENANRQRRFRERQKQLALTVTDGSVTENNAIVTKNNESKSKRKSKSKSKNSYIDEFERLWEMYPKKQGKANALKAFQKAREGGVAYETIENGIVAYKGYLQANKTEQRYIKQGSTWFNQQCWNDDYKISAYSNTSSHGIERDEDLDAMLIRQIQNR